MSTRTELLKRIASYDFAVVELNLFLNSHPNDNVAISKLEEYVTKSNNLRQEFENKFGPLTAELNKGNCWAWISDPWPWDTIKEDDK